MHGFSDEKLENDLVEIVYETENMGVYFFVLDLIANEECAELHSIAFSLLCNVFNCIEGAYYLAYNHMKRAVEMDKDNYEYKEGLLLFYHVPEKILDKNEAMKIANEILLIALENPVANAILNEK